MTAATSPATGRFLPQQRQRSAVALLVGAVLLVGLVQGGVLSFFYTPLIVGLSYLSAAAVAGRAGALWAPGLVTSCWGVAALLGLYGVIPGEKASYLIAGLIGAGLAVLLRLAAGLAAGPIGIVVSLAAIALYDNQHVPSWVFNGATFAALLAGWALWDLRPARRR